MAGLLALPSLAFAQNSLKSHPAYLPIDETLDMSTIKPEVNVNLPKFLLAEAAAGVDAAPENGLKEAGINLQELVQDIQLIRVLVIPSDGDQKAKLAEGLSKLREVVSADWIPLVMVPDDGVGVYAKSNEAGDSMEGLAAIIGEEGDDAVIINVVGKVPLAKIISMASSMDKFPKDLLKNLGGFVKGETPPPSSGKNKEKNNN